MYNIYNSKYGVFMEKDKVFNVVSGIYTALLASTLQVWKNNPHKSFLACWKDVLMSCDGITFSNNESKSEMVKKYGRDMLAEAVGYSSNFAVAQAFAYANELVSKNYTQFEGEDRKAFANLKRSFLEGNLNNDQILKVIRQSMAHNTDEGRPNFYYDSTNQKFVFQLNNNKEVITISPEQLTDVMGLYLKNMVSKKESEYMILLKLKDILEGKSSKDSEQIQLISKKDKKFITPDEYQKETLAMLSNYIKCRQFVPKQQNLYFYPYKENSFTNCLKSLGTKYFLQKIYCGRMKGMDEFFDENNFQSLPAFEDCCNIQDYSSFIFANLIFQIFSTTPPSVIQECFESINPDINVQRIRNAIMHGTYFYNKNDRFVFYDGREKQEDKLTFVGTLCFEEVYLLLDRIMHKKIPAFQSGEKISMHTENTQDDFSL